MKYLFVLLFAATYNGTIHDETTKIKDRRQMIRAFPGKAVDYIYSFFMHIA